MQCQFRDVKLVWLKRQKSKKCLKFTTGPKGCISQLCLARSNQDDITSFTRKKKPLPSHGSSWNICLETSWKNLQGTLKNHLFLKGKTSSKQTMFGFYLKFPGCKLYLCSQLLHMNFAGNHEKLHQIKNLLVELFPPSVFSSTYIIADSWTINGWQTLLGCPWYLVTGL